MEKLKKVSFYKFIIKNYLTCLHSLDSGNSDDDEDELLGEEEYLNKHKPSNNFIQNNFQTVNDGSDTKVNPTKVYSRNKKDSEDYKCLLNNEVVNNKIILEENSAVSSPNPTYLNTNQRSGSKANEHRGKKFQNYNSGDSNLINNSQANLLNSNAEEVSKDKDQNNYDNQFSNVKFKSENSQQMFASKYKNYPKIKTFFKYIISYYRLIVMLDEEKKILFSKDELDIIISIITSCNIMPSIQRVFSAVISKFIIQYQIEEDPGDKNNKKDADSMESPVEVKRLKERKNTTDKISPTVDDPLFFVIKTDKNKNKASDFVFRRISAELHSIKKIRQDYSIQRNSQLETRKSNHQDSSGNGGGLLTTLINKAENIDDDETGLRNIEGLTLLLIESTYTIFPRFKLFFEKNPKCYLTHFNDCVLSPVINCCFRSNFLREDSNYQNKYAFYNIILAFLTAFKVFLENLLTFSSEDKIEYIGRKIKGTIRTQKTLKDNPNQSELNKMKTIKNVIKENAINMENTKKEHYDGNDKALESQENRILKIVEEYSYYFFTTEKEVINILLKLETDINSLKNDEYDTFNNYKTSEIFRYYLKFINVQTVCSAFNDKIKISKNEFLDKILTKYDSLKRDYQTIALNNVSKRGDPISDQLKIEMLEICERVVRKKESQLDMNRYLYFLFKTKLRLFKMDKKLFQNYSMKQHINFSFNNNVIMYLGKIFKSSILKQYLSVIGTNNSFEYSIFNLITDFYSHLCLNGNTNAQAFLSGLTLYIDKIKPTADGNNENKQATVPLNNPTKHFLMKNKISPNLNVNKETTFVGFFMNIAGNVLKYLSYYTTKKDIIYYLEIQQKSEYFKLLYKGIISMLCNLLIGCYPHIYINSFRLKEFYSWFNTNTGILNKINKHQTYVFYSKEFIRFCSVILEENTNIDKKFYLTMQDKKIKGQVPIKFILKGIKPALLVNIVKVNIKKLVDESENITGNKIAYSHSSFLSLYMSQDPIVQDDKFILCEEIYYFLMNLKYKSDQTTKITNLLSIQERIKNQEFIFFSRIYKKVEYVYKTTDSIDPDIYEKVVLFGSEKQKKLFELIEMTPRNTINIIGNHVFKLCPQVFYLTLKDFEDLYWVKLENSSMKHSIMLNLSTKLKNLAENRMSLMIKSSRLTKYMIKFNYLNEDIITFFSLKVTVLISTVINGMLLYEDLTLTQLDDIKANKKDVDAKIFDKIHIINLGHIIFLAVFIINWVFFNFYFNIQKSKWSIITGKLPVYSNFVNGIISLISRKTTFLYACLLFSYVSITPTMKLVVKALVDKWETFIHTGALILIICWFFSGLAFYYQNDDYYFDELKRNICDTYLNCFLSITNYNLRMAFIDPTVLSISDDFYYKRFFLETFFWMIVNLILLNAINGIIVDTFQTFREEDNVQIEQMNNVCYVCSLKRGELEMFGINFENHTKEEHLVYTYMEHLISIQYKSSFEMNYMDYFVSKLLKQELYSFIPHKECKALKDYLSSD